MVYTNAEPVGVCLGESKMSYGNPWLYASVGGRCWLVVGLPNKVASFSPEFRISKRWANRLNR